MLIQLVKDTLNKTTMIWLLSSFAISVEIDKKNNSHNEEHISNYIKAVFKTENLKSCTKWY